MVASLTRTFGPAYLGLAEEVVQEALVQALKRWPFHGIPEKPEAWLYRVARNLAIDRLRRELSFRGKEIDIRESLMREPSTVETSVFDGRDGGIEDDALRLVFLCCHPALPQDARVALTLKTVGGFSVPEIARAFLSAEATIAQRLVRAKARIRELGLPFELPVAPELEERLDAVLEVVYLTFNEGYAAHQCGDLVRSDVCAEALRLAALLSNYPSTNSPVVHALLALLLFQSSRLPARVDASGDLVLLADQDRSLWDSRLVERGFEALDRSARGTALSPYHVQAAIAAEHAGAARSEDTDWPGILDLYDQLLEINPSPVVALNRAVAVAEVQGPRAGLAALAEIEAHPALREYYLLPATRAELLARTGAKDEAAASYRAALELATSEPERRFLMKKLQVLTSSV